MITKILLTVVLLFLPLTETVLAEIVDIQPVRNSGKSGVLGELEDRMPAGYAAIYVTTARDIVGTAHEQTHGLNALIRRQQPDRYNAFYCFGGRALVLPEPAGITLSSVASNSPAEIRSGTIYVTYMRQARQWWDNEPLYILDEMVAYYNGAAAGIENGSSGDRCKNSLANAAKLKKYARVLLGLCKRTGYSHSDELEQFLLEADDYHKQLKEMLLERN